MTNEVVHLQRSEYEFHEAGVAQGHVKAKREAAKQLRQAREHYLGLYEEKAKTDENVAKSMETIEAWLAAFEALAAQFDAEVKQTEPLVKQHMDLGTALRPRQVPRLHERIIGAIIGAADGFNTGKAICQENESSRVKR